MTIVGYVIGGLLDPISALPMIAVGGLVRRWWAVILAAALVAAAHAYLFRSSEWEPLAVGAAAFVFAMVQGGGTLLLRRWTHATPANPPGA